PDGVVLTSLKQDSEILTLNGRAQSNTRVSTYMRNLEGSGWMTRPELSIIEAKGFEQGLPYQFTLTVRLANPTAPVDEDGDGVPDAPPPVSEAVALEGEAAALAGPADATEVEDAAPAPVEGDDAGAVDPAAAEAPAADAVEG